MEKRRTRRQRWAGRAAVVGVLMALVCHALPADYQSICKAAAQIVPLLCGIGAK